MFSRRTAAALPKALALAAVCAAVAVPTAHAATAPAPTAPAPTATKSAKANVVGQKLFYTAASGQKNNLTISWALGATDPDSTLADYIYTFDDTVTISLGAGCVRPDAGDDTKAVCTVTEPNTSASDLDSLIVDLGDGDDTATVNPDNNGYARIYGGTGNDTLTGHGMDVLYGQDGNDHLSGGGGVYDEGAYGGAGDDTLTKCAAECHGGTGNDSLSGTSTGNTLSGDDGNDKLYGNAGRDLLQGGKGNDTLYGGTSDDKLYGNSGNDVLHGGAGNDFLSGGPGSDKVYQS
ncbi:calcium-binding protein [Streptomyces sp. NPDC058467]|uniref:calcium-binding protein n=1 Tax=Streptomyces sp. NPDC058467 TaxID=3346513 RepID=UPI0036560E61